MTAGRNKFLDSLYRLVWSVFLQGNNIWENEKERWNTAEVILWDGTQSSLLTKGKNTTKGNKQYLDKSHSNNNYYRLKNNPFRAIF